jgi:hypothetical protein
MAVFREIAIPFGGAEYNVTPSNKVLRRIEMKGRRDDPSFNLVAVFYRATSQSGAFYDLSFVLAELINSAGGKVTEDDALAEFMAFKDPRALSDYVALICSCVMPEAKEDEVKKQEGAGTKAA